MCRYELNISMWNNTPLCIGSRWYCALSHLYLTKPALYFIPLTEYEGKTDQLSVRGSLYPTGALRPVSTKPFRLTYVKLETDVCKKHWLGGHRPFANRPADTVSSRPSDSWLTLANNTCQRRRTGDKLAQWTRAFTLDTAMFANSKHFIP